MVAIGGRPILWHIMRHYASFGFDDFVVACGYKGYVIKEYFANYLTHECDCRSTSAPGRSTFCRAHPQDWHVTLVDTGAATMTGGRSSGWRPLPRRTVPADVRRRCVRRTVDDLVAYHRKPGPSPP